LLETDLVFVSTALSSVTTSSESVIAFRRCKGLFVLCGICGLDPPYLALGGGGLLSGRLFSRSILGLFFRCGALGTLSDEREELLLLSEISSILAIPSLLQLDERLWSDKSFGSLAHRVTARRRIDFLSFCFTFLMNALE